MMAWMNTIVKVFDILQLSEVIKAKKGDLLFYI